MSSSARRWWVWAAIMVLVAVQIVSPWPNLTPDAVGYFSMARSLAQDGTLLRFGDPHVRYGPAYPVAIAPLFWLSPEPFLLLNLLNVALLAVFGRVVYVWALEVATEAAPYIAALAVVNVVVLAMFRRPLSETLFCPLLFGVAIGYNRALAGTLKPRWWAILVPCSCVLALTRQAGLLVTVGFATALLWQAIRGRRGWRSAIGFAVLAVAPPTAAVILWAAIDGARVHRPGDFSHVAALKTGPGPDAADMPTSPLSRRVIEGLRVRVAEVGRVTLPLMSKVYARSETWLHASTFIYFPWFALIVYGWLRHLRESDDAIAWMWPFYFALYVYWPFDQAARFTAPLVPLLMVCLWRAVGNLGGWRPKLFAVLTVLHLLIALGTWIVTERPRGYGLWMQWPELRRIADDFRDRPDELAVDPEASELARPLEFWLDRAVPVSIPGETGRFVVGWSDELRRVPLEQRRVVVRPTGVE
ncbi:MAG: hypothetical protein K8U57_09525 [Planctomycetes bacterium]|nr:hypothetical protein [Planctomycetota bacterium]